jgi:hypothetical protein
MPTFTVYIETEDERKMASLPDRIIGIAMPAPVSQPQGGVYQFSVGEERVATTRERLRALVGDVRVIER